MIDFPVIGSLLITLSYNWINEDEKWIDCIIQYFICRDTGCQWTAILTIPLYVILSNNSSAGNFQSDGIHSILSIIHEKCNLSD